MEAPLNFLKADATDITDAQKISHSVQAYQYGLLAMSVRRSCGRHSVGASCIRQTRLAAVI